MTGGVLAQVVRIDVAARDRVFTDPPGQIVVAVDQRCLFEYPPRAREIRIISWR